MTTPIEAKSIQEILGDPAFKHAVLFGARMAGVRYFLRARHPERYAEGFDSVRDADITEAIVYVDNMVRMIEVKRKEMEKEMR